MKKVRRGEAFTEAPRSKYCTVLGAFTAMNPHKILLVLVTHIFYTKKLRYNEIN